MQAYVIKNYGPKGGHLIDTDRPKVDRGCLLIKICAASINPLDLMIQKGDFKSILPYKTPFILGHDLAGVIVEKGEDSGRFNIGDEVISRPRDLSIGSFAEYIAVSAEDVALKPKNLSMEEAASVPLVALAAWQLLTQKAAISPGQRVLVHAGGGGLGSTVVQVARELGAVVATTVSSKDVEKVIRLGASEIINYENEDFSTQQKKYDLVIDAVGQDNLLKSFKVVKKGGKIVSVVGPPDAHFALQLKKWFLLPILYLMSFKVKRLARKLGISYSFFFMQANGAQLSHLVSLYETSKLLPTVDKVFPLQKIDDAMAYVREGRARGKVVLSI